MLESPHAQASAVAAHIAIFAIAEFHLGSLYILNTSWS
jgi:hypothetical protein